MQKEENIPARNVTCDVNNRSPCLTRLSLWQATFVSTFPILLALVEILRGRLHDAVCRAGRCAYFISCRFILIQARKQATCRLCSGTFYKFMKSGVRRTKRSATAFGRVWLVDERTREWEKGEREKESEETEKERGREWERRGGGGRHGGKNKRREWSAVWKYKVGCKDCEFWGFCSFASFSSTLAYEKIHRLNGLVYYFLYPSRPPCESSAKKSATFYPLPLVSSAFSLSGGVSLSPFRPLSEVNQPKKCALRLICRSVFRVPRVPRCIHIFLFRTINHKLMCARPRRVYGCLRGSFEEIKIELLARD